MSPSTAQLFASSLGDCSGYCPHRRVGVLDVFGIRVGRVIAGLGSELDDSSPAFDVYP